MNRTRMLVVAVCFTVAVGYAWSDDVKKSANGPKEAASKLDEVERVTVDDARRQAKLMQKIYSATLEAMHHHFFRRERAVLPARAMEDIFANLEQESNIRAKWIAVNTKAMSINHEPASDFEKKAAAAIAAGKEDFEAVAEGYYSRATPIPLGSGCITCHTGFFAKAPTSPRYAGLVIQIPVRKE